MNLFRLFRKQPKIRVIRRDSNKLRLHEFRSDSALVGIAQKVFTTPDFDVLLSVLNNEHPAMAVLPFNAQPHERAAHQARCEGYTIALANIEAMTKYAPVPKELEATFEPETEE